MRNSLLLIQVACIVLTLPASLQIGGWMWLFTVITVLSALLTERMTR